MALVLGVNAVFHDPSAAIVRDGRIVAAAEEERFSRRKHGKPNVPFSAWELPEQAIAWCLAEAGASVEDLDAIAYGYDPSLAPPARSLTDDGWEALRTLYAQRAPRFLSTILPGLDPSIVRYVPHHLAHAASAYLAAPYGDAAVIVLDGRGEQTSFLGGVATGGRFDPVARQELPHSLGLLYEDLTEHLGFHRSSDEYKVMGLAAHGTPQHLGAFRQLIRSDGTGYQIEPIPWESFTKRHAGDVWRTDEADLAASVQARIEEVLLALADHLHGACNLRSLVMAGGVALNCVANTRLWREGPFRDIWVQPAAGDAGTSLGAALHVAQELGDPIQPMASAALGRGWSDEEIAAALDTARIDHRRSNDLASEVASLVAKDAIVAWFQGRSEFGPRALGHRSLLADPRAAGNLERMNDIKGREQFRPIAPMVLERRAAEIFEGPLPSPYMLFTHRVKSGWRDRIPAVTHVDGTARVQTVDAAQEPLVAAMLEAFDRLTGVPLVVNTSLNTAGRPIVDSPRDVLELFGSTPVDALAIGPFMVYRDRAAVREAAA
jgi:carbamoyltransferase